MRVRFYAVEAKGREQEIAAAVGEGVTRAGDRFEVVDAASYAEPVAGVDVACCFALKGAAKRILSEYPVMGARTLLFDKGLIRASTGLGAPAGYFRVALDGFMPLERMMRQPMPPSRWLATGLRPLKRRGRPDFAPVIYAGSSQKYSAFHELGDATEFAEDVIRRIRKRGLNRPIVYRPKPSWDEAVPIDGTFFSRPPEMLGGLLPHTWALVTHGSHAAIDAILAGVPAVVLGQGAARPVSGTNLGTLENPFWPTDEERFHWLCAISWWQWRLDEMRDGQMWRFLRAEMEIE